MGTDLVAHSAHAQRVFEMADQITGLPISHLCATGPLEELTATQIAQPAVVATSLAAVAVLRESLPIGPRAVAGHSVGELAAYVIAGALDETACLELVHRRAQAMQRACDAVDGSMSAVLGLDETTLRRVCAQASHDGSSVEIANDNAPGQLIVAGDRDALDRLTVLARGAGARRVVPLNVGGPFHSVYMRPAVVAFQEALTSAPIRDAEQDVVLNVTAEPARTATDLREELAVQLASRVRWTDSLRALSALGCDRFVEVGPGNVLAGLVKRTLPDARVVSFGALADLPKVAAILEN